MKVLERLLGISKDKWVHICVSACIAFVLKMTLCFFHLSYPNEIALLATIAIGALKEIRDKATKKGTPEFADFVSDVVGAVIGSF